MPDSESSRLIRIAVFYDGNYLLHVSNYYAFHNIRQSRLSLQGLHQFMRHAVAQEHGTVVHRCQIVDMHLFRARLPAHEAQQRGKLLYYERVFDDILMWEGVVTHYLLARHGSGRKEERDVSMWLAMEALELAALKQYDVVVLVTPDGDYTPLVRKLHTQGCQVFVVSWDYDYVDEHGQRQVTRTSQELSEEASVHIAMNKIISDPGRVDDPIVANLFVTSDKRGLSKNEPSDAPHQHLVDLEVYRTDDDGSDELFESTILSLKSAYGFIRHRPNNLFFHAKDLLNADFSKVSVGDSVVFTLGVNADDEHVAKRVRVVTSN